MSKPQSGTSKHNTSEADSSTQPSACMQCETSETQTGQSPKQVIQPHKKALLNRLSRVQGQVNGVSQMIENDRYCVDIITQISAIRSALDAVSKQLLDDHVKGCVRRAVLDDNTDEVMDELLTLIKKMR